MRSAPWRMIVGSRVPSASMRLRTTSVAVSMAWSMACFTPASVGVRTKREPSSTAIFQSRWPVMPAPVVSGRMISRAASTWVGSSSMKDSLPSLLEMSPMRMRGSDWRKRARTVSSMFSSRWRRTCVGSASSRMWLPPARSRPRLIIGAGSASGQRTLASENSDGKAAAIAAMVRNQYQACFQRGKSSMSASALRLPDRRPDQSFAGLPAVGEMTSAIVDFSALTFTLGPSSSSA